MSAEEEDPIDVFVRVEDCRGRHSKIDLALFGLEGTGGIVKDIHDIKANITAYSGFLRQFVVPVAVAVIVALLVKYL